MQVSSPLPHPVSDVLRHTTSVQLGEDVGGGGGLQVLTLGAKLYRRRRMMRQVANVGYSSGSLHLFLSGGREPRLRIYVISLQLDRGGNLSACAELSRMASTIRSSVRHVCGFTFFPLVV